MARPRKGEEKHAFKQIGVRIPDTMRAKLDAIAARTDRIVSDVIREAIEIYLKKSAK